MSFPRIPSILLLATILPLAAQAQPAPKAPTSPKPYLTINGTPIPQSTADNFLATLKSRGAPETDELRNAVREEMIRRGLLLAEAKKHALDKTPEYKQHLQDATQMLLMQAAVAKYLTENPVTDTDLRAAYNAFVVQLGNSEYKLRGLRLSSEADAQKVLARLKDGKKFTRLINEYAEGPDKEKGGDLGWNAPSALPPAVASALRALKKNDHTPTPIKLDSGWHLFQLEDLRPLTPPAFEHVRAQLAQSLVQAKIAHYLQNLRAQADIK